MTPEPESDTFRMLRYKTRLNESNAMKEEKSDWQKEIEDWNKSLLKNERNNGREDVYDALRAIWGDKFMYDLSPEDLIQSLKIHLNNKG